MAEIDSTIGRHLCRALALRSLAQYRWDQHNAEMRGAAAEHLGFRGDVTELWAQYRDEVEEGLGERVKTAADAKALIDFAARIAVERFADESIEEGLLSGLEDAVHQARALGCAGRWVDDLAIREVSAARQNAGARTTVEPVTVEQPDGSRGVYRRE